MPGLEKASKKKANKPRRSAWKEVSPIHFKYLKNTCRLILNTKVLSGKCKCKALPEKDGQVLEEMW